MEIRPVNPVGTSAPVHAATPSFEHDQSVRTLVTAVREVNKAELLGQGRELSFRRDPATRQPVIAILDKSTGDVIDQIPPESVLQLAEQLK
jgi:uncharacterized FlaG/YvyC family protein